eukprot:COSAG02_NODE_3582_length_6531_cov_4.696206_5_plen_84_part_00
MVTVGKDMAHFLCFLRVDAFGTHVDPLLNLTVMQSPSTDRCGCAKDEGCKHTAIICSTMPFHYRDHLPRLHGHTLLQTIVSCC